MIFECVKQNKYLYNVKNVINISEDDKEITSVVLGDIISPRYSPIIYTIDKDNIKFYLNNSTYISTDSLNIIPIMIRKTYDLTNSIHSYQELVAPPNATLSFYINAPANFSHTMNINNSGYDTNEGIIYSYILCYLMYVGFYRVYFILGFFAILGKVAL